MIALRYFEKTREVVTQMYGSLHEERWICGTKHNFNVWHRKLLKTIVDGIFLQLQPLWVKRNSVVSGLSKKSLYPEAKTANLSQKFWWRMFLSANSTLPLKFKTKEAASSAEMLLFPDFSWRKTSFSTGKTDCDSLACLLFVAQMGIFLFLMCNNKCHKRQPRHQHCQFWQLWRPGIR